MLQARPANLIGLKKAALKQLFLPVSAAMPKPIGFAAMSVQGKPYSVCVLAFHTQTYRVLPGC
jgi:hypothetical protein